MPDCQLFPFAAAVLLLSKADYKEVRYKGWGSSYGSPMRSCVPTSVLHHPCSRVHLPLRRYPTPTYQPLKVISILFSSEASLSLIR